MSEINETRCFKCRQLVEDPPVLNQLEDGSSCPACSDRVLDALPSLLPSSPVELEIEDVEEGERGPRSLVLVDGEDEVAEEDYEDPPQPA